MMISTFHLISPPIVNVPGICLSYLGHQALEVSGARDAVPAGKPVTRPDALQQPLAFAVQLLHRSLQHLQRWRSREYVSWTTITYFHLQRREYKCNQSPFSLVVCAPLSTDGILPHPKETLSSTEAPATHSTSVKSEIDGSFNPLKNLPSIFALTSTHPFIRAPAGPPVWTAGERRWT